MSLIAIHPGEHLAIELDELGMSAADFARKLDVPGNRISEFLTGKHALDVNMASRLASFFGTSEKFWLNLQGLYDARITK